MPNAWKIYDPIIGLQAIDATETSATHTLGSRIKAKHVTYGVGEFIYLKGVASTVVGSVVLINPDDWSTSLATANDVGKLGVAMSANVANQYGWYQIYGKGAAKVLTGFVDNADCYLTATAGSVDDADVAGDYVRGMKGASAIDTPSTGLAEVELGYPEVADGKDN
jgi:hypothetical protein